MEKDGYTASQKTLNTLNKAPRSKLRGIKAELRRLAAQALAQREPTRLRPSGLRRGSPRHSSLQQAAGYFGEGE